MYQIDNSTVVADQPASTAAGTAGFFSDGNPATGAAATIVPAEFLNMVMVEMLGVLSAGGVTPSKNTYNQLATSIKALIQGGGSNYAADTGTANTYTVSYVPAITTLSDGMSLKFKAKTTNTGASTFNGKPLLSIAQAQLLGGEVVANGRCVVLYSLTLDSWILISATGGNAMSGRLINIQIITASGTYTPTPGMSFCIVEAVGGGGGSGIVVATSSTQVASSGGAQAGAYGKSKFTYSQVAAGVACTIGTGGVGGIGASLSSSTSGSNTSFGSLMTVSGGARSLAGPTSALSTTVLSVPASSTQSITGANLYQKTGEPGSWGCSNSDGNQLGGSGGSTPLGAGGLGSGNTGSANPGTGYGAGGGGTCSTISSAAKNGAAGANGVIIVWEYE